MSSYSPLQLGKRAYQAGIMGLAGILAGAGCSTQPTTTELPKGMSVAALMSQYDVNVNPRDPRAMSATAKSSAQPVTTIDDLLQSPGYAAKLDELQYGKSFYSINPNIPGVDLTRAYMTEDFDAVVHAYRVETHKFKGLKDVHGNATVIRYNFVQNSDMTPEVVDALDKEPEFIQSTDRKDARKSDAVVATVGAAAYILGVNKFQNAKVYRDGILGALGYFGLKQIGTNRDIVQSDLHPASPALDDRLENMYSYVLFDSNNNPIMLQSRATMKTSKDAKDKMAFSGFEHYIKLPSGTSVKVLTVDQLYCENSEDYALVGAALGGFVGGKFFSGQYDKPTPATNSGVTGGPGPKGPVIITPTTPPKTVIPITGGAGPKGPVIIKPGPG